MQRSDRFLISARVRMFVDHPHELSELVQRCACLPAKDEQGSAPLVSS